jgi:hypothetical protein
MKKKLLKSKKDREEFLFWIATLESGALPKGKNTLQTDDDKYCCLGVGVVCTVPVNNLSVHSDNVLRGGYPDAQDVPEWLANINDDFKDRTGTKLSNLNDNRGWSHPRIARKLLETYKNEL